MLHSDLNVTYCELKKIYLDFFNENEINDEFQKCLYKIDHDFCDRYVYTPIWYFIDRHIYELPVYNRAKDVQKPNLSKILELYNEFKINSESFEIQCLDQIVETGRELPKEINDIIKQNNDFFIPKYEIKFIHINDLKSYNSSRPKKLIEERKLTPTEVDLLNRMFEKLIKLYI